MKILFINTLENEYFWGRRVVDGIHMPYKPGFKCDLRNPGGNQVSYLLMSNFGRVIWSEQPFSFEVTETGIQVEGTGEVFSETHGTTLKEACMWAQNTLYQKKTGIPPREFFTKPQFNT